MCFGGLASQCLDPADTGRYRAFADNMEKPDIAGTRHMRAATKLD